MAKYLLEFDADDDYDRVYDDVKTAMGSLVQHTGDWTLTKHIDLPTRVRELEAQVTKLSERLAGVIENHHLWDGS